MFRSFASRLTRGYAAMAFFLIVAVVVTSTVLAFVLFSRGLNEALSTAAQRVGSDAAHYASLHYSLAKAAPLIANAGRQRFRVAVFDDAGHLLAANSPSPHATAASRIEQVAGSLIGLRRERVRIAGGTVLLSTDIARFGQILLWYWSIMLPVGIIAVLLAWWTGRRTSAAAIGPLVEVTRALENVAAGDFTPQRLLTGSRDLGELTAAYNNVALALTAASVQRQQADAQMRQFIADAGHELRTPLTVIMGYVDVLKNGVVSDSAGTARVYDTMLDESRRMRALIDRLILLARLDRAADDRQSGTMDLAQVVRRAAKALEPLDPQRRVHVDSLESISVSGHETEVYEAVKNAIDNALKYGGDSAISIGLERNGTAACVCVADEGPGMNPEDLAHAFDRFYRGAGRDNAEGSGLGLAIARRAVERAGGTISLQSAPGAGTRLRLCLPLQGA